MTDFTSVYSSSSGFASANTRFHCNTSPAATAPLKSAPVTSLVSLWEIAASKNNLPK
jgi:hypothetical protein